MKKNVFILALLWGTWATARAGDVESWLDRGKALVDSGQTDAAVVQFRKVLEASPKHYDALVFLCNYHYLKGQQQLDSIEAWHRSLVAPTRMQSAHYQDLLKKVYVEWYAQAEGYLVKAYLIRRNDWLDELAGKIVAYKERIGLSLPGKNASLFRRKPLP